MTRDWSHQDRGVEMLRQSVISGKRSPILCMATGGGKSRLAGQIIKSAVEMSKDVLFIVHRRNLVHQFVDMLKTHFGIDSGYIMSGKEYVAGKRVYCGTVQTIGPRLESGVLSGDMFQAKVSPDIIIIDECHRGISPQYTKIYDAFGMAIKIGLTATPCRSDERGLGEIFDDIVDVADTAFLTGKEILTPVRYFVPDAEGLDKIKKKRAGEYDGKEQDSVFNTVDIVGDSVSSWLKCAENRPTILFAVNVAHSIALQNEFLKHSVTALHLDARSSDEERDEAFKKVEQGEAHVVCNVGLYVEGVDVPDIWCVQIARKVCSLGAYRQIVGRGLRNMKNPKYENCIVIDQGGNHARHGPVTDEIKWSLDGKEKAWKKKAEERKKKKQVKCKSCEEVFEGLSKCPQCGTDLVRYGKKVEAVDGELVEVDPLVANKVTEWVEKRLVMGAIRWHCEKKGYKSGWAAHGYRSLFSVWPNDKRVSEAPPIKPGKGSYADRQLERLLIIKAAEFKNKKRSM